MIGGKLDFKKEMFDRKNCVNVGKRHILNSAQCLLVLVAGY